MKQRCSIAGCDQPVLCRGWCNRHYKRWERHGDPLAGGASPVHGSRAERFWPKVDRDNADECWPWRGGILANGYGLFDQTTAHRTAYELAIGPIPRGHQIDHLCRNRACQNPAHLEAVTQRENILRGESLSAKQARQTHCKRGHAFDEANTLVSGGKRFCRACARIRQQQRRPATP